MTLLSKQSLQERWKRLHQRLKDLEADGMLVTNLTSVRYLSGFTGSTGLLLFLPNSRHFISDGRYQEQAHQQVVDFQIHIDTGDAGRAGQGLFGFIQEQGLLDGPYRLAYEADHVSVSRFNDWCELFPNIEWVETTQLVAEVAVIKDDEELVALTEAVRITDLVFEDLKDDLKPGTTEREVAARLAYLLRHHGSEGDSFDPVIASGPRSALPHSSPSDKSLDSGDFVVLDFGARHGGYHADMTRTVCIAEATDRHHEVYSIVLEAQRRGIAAARDNIPASRVDAACRDYITEKGFGEYFLHATGHGVGLEIHTQPRLSRESSDILKANMVVTVEPGIYLPDWGGVRIEDDVLIRADDCIPLNRTTRELLILG
ncbi:MAG: aminopeptidase P family protein [Fidelibacterota bacterium]|nr:MAG: aminopeptidase P family protein [Candidatus Neomarinimicrobiota bacterium]